MLNQLSYIRKTTPLKDFYINDLNVTNFIVNPSNCELSIIDLDSAKIGTNAACPARLLTPKALLNNVKGKYNINEDKDVLGHVIADENSDLNELSQENELEEREYHAEIITEQN